MLDLALLKQWVLGIMVAMEPTAAWRNTYPDTAEAISHEALEYPLFADDDGRRTASVFVSLGWFEGTFQPNAEGDCVNASGQRVEKVREITCPKGTRPRSFCLFQIHETNLRGLDVTRDQLQSDVRVCTRTAGRLVHDSFKMCRSRPLDARLNWYATGGDTCLADVPKGVHRMQKAQWIFGRYPIQADTL